MFQFSRCLAKCWYLRKYKYEMSNNNYEIRKTCKQSIKRSPQKLYLTTNQCTEHRMLQLSIQTISIFHDSIFFLGHFIFHGAQILLLLLFSDLPAPYIISLSHAKALYLYLFSRKSNSFHTLENWHTRTQLTTI